ncbi:MAG: hypothetical protein GY753_20175 [Gammaproteobacteria bacterium]|nr:hypothetical protein [Gammaproteobacteria bacterium]
MASLKRVAWLFTIGSSREIPGFIQQCLATIQNQPRLPITKPKGRINSRLG